jgi:heptosyltransferase III
MATADGAGPVRRILAIRPRALGDVVLTTPALRALAAGHPQARLEVATEPRYAPLVSGLPGVAEVLPIGRDPGAATRLIGEVRRRRYDLVVDFFGNPRTALIARASGARVRAGYQLRGRQNAYTMVVAREVRPARGEREYAADVHVRLAKAAGGAPDGGPPAIAISESVRAEGAALLASAGVRDRERTVGLVAGGTWATKTLPLSHVSQIARQLEAAGWKLVLLSGPGEAHDVRTLGRLNPEIAVLPPCDVSGLAGAISQLAAVVGTDSGPRHLAAALGVASWAWFGPTHPDTWSPPGPRHGHAWTELPCRGCDRTSCPHWSCMPGFDAGFLADRILEHLNLHARDAAGLGPAARA